MFPETARRALGVDFSRLRGLFLDEPGTDLLTYDDREPELIRSTVFREGVR
jgi:hypothetical protein